jgi:hypothetical protein
MPSTVARRDQGTAPGGSVSHRDQHGRADVAVFCHWQGAAVSGGLQVVVRRQLPGELAQDEVLDVRTPGEVAHLVTVLSDQESDDAYATHLGRPTEVDLLEGEEVPDHVMYFAVREGAWGYLRYIGPIPGRREAGAYRPAGDRSSPGTHGTNNPEYAAGSGLPLDAFEQVVTEFLTTSELPAGVRWVSE